MAILMVILMEILQVMEVTKAMENMVTNKKVKDIKTVLLYHQNVLIMDVETISIAWEEFARAQSLVMPAQQMLSAHKAKFVWETTVENCYVTRMETVMVTNVDQENAAIDLNIKSFIQD